MANDRSYGEPRRTIRISDELWDAALATAVVRRHEGAKDETVPEVVRDALAAYAAAPEKVRRYLARHRKEES